jgi:hypothetical protein
MGAILGASWLPKVFGILAGLFGGLSVLQEFPADVAGWLRFLAEMLISGGLLTVKQSNVSNAEHPKPAAILVQPGTTAEAKVAKAAAKESVVPIRVIKP